MNELLNYLSPTHSLSIVSVIVICVTFLAMTCSFITECIKELPYFNTVPTKLLCYAVAILVTTPSAIAMLAFFEIPVEWYMCFAAFLASFIVAKVAIGGWDDVMEIYTKMKGDR